MANRGSGNVIEGRSHTRPPYFDGSNYGTWKLKMKIFIQSQDRLLWRIIVKGFNYPTKKIDGKDVVKGEEEFDFEEGKLFDLNVRAINLLYCAINDEEFNRLSIYESAKEIWDRLKITYEGTPELKESRISILMDKFEKFKMIKGESIDDMHKRFLEIIHPLKNLGKSFAAMELVKKFMKSVIPPYTSKIDAIEEGRDFEKITLDILVSKLVKKEMEIKGNDEVQVKGKSIALKATSKYFSSEEDNSEEEMVLLSQQFKDYLKGKSKSKKKKYLRRSETSSKEDVPTCYKCKKPGHIQPQCPLYKKSKAKKKKAMVATWSDEDPTSCNSSDKEESSGFVAFMAHRGSDSEVSSSSTDSISLQDKFDELVDCYEKLKALYKKNKKNLASLNKSNDELNAKVIELHSEKECLSIELEASKFKLDDAHKTQDELSSMHIKYDQLLKTNELLQSECLALKKYNVDLSASLAKISSEKQHTKTMLATSKQTQKHSIRYVQKTHRAHSPSNPQIICNYCERLGHIAHSCPYKKSNVKVIWAPKCAKTNTNGPKVSWVPKTKT